MNKAGEISGIFDRENFKNIYKREYVIKLYERVTGLQKIEISFEKKGKVRNIFSQLVSEWFFWKEENRKLKIREEIFFVFASKILFPFRERIGKKKKNNHFILFLPQVQVHIVSEVGGERREKK